MGKHIELIKKLKALAERGIGGEAINAQKLLGKLLLKHNLTIDDVETEIKQDYYFKAKGIKLQLLLQIVGVVNREIKCYSLPSNKAKISGFKVNIILECTTAEFIEIEQMFNVYQRLYEEESKLFYRAFLQANNLMMNAPIEEQRKLSDLSEKEKEQWYREMKMAETIKKESIKKQLNQVSK